MIDLHNMMQILTQKLKDGRLYVNYILIKSGSPTTLSSTVASNTIKAVLPLRTVPGEYFLSKKISTSECLMYLFKKYSRQILSEVWTLTQVYGITARDMLLAGVISKISIGMTR